MCNRNFPCKRICDPFILISVLKKNRCIINCILPVAKPYSDHCSLPRFHKTVTLSCSPQLFIINPDTVYHSCRNAKPSPPAMAFGSAACEGSFHQKAELRKRLLGNNIQKAPAFRSGRDPAVFQCSGNQKRWFKSVISWI